ncbi:hypothetical protein [Amycolatopsis samaneae]|uniref:Uncharacterized protein n=1 Tax=Amycolatopsis samaneae TaxID=664691 RepID=A0ABW5GWJ9_9PSEU
MSITSSIRSYSRVLRAKSRYARPNAVSPSVRIGPRCITARTSLSSTSAPSSSGSSSGMKVISEALAAASMSARYLDFAAKHRPGTPRRDSSAAMAIRQLI